MLNFSKITLNEWMFKSIHSDHWLTARVPGCVHTDLLRNGQIPEPFYGTHEKELQWIDKQDWEYAAEFDLSHELLTHSHAELVFDGLDTYADVYLNDELLLHADNMFRTWRIDVRSLLKPKGNKLRILFHSPIRTDLPKLERLDFAYPAPNDDSTTGGLGERKISVFARKAPYHYGWDWGPRFVTSGIWREERRECWSAARVTDVFIRQNKVNAQLAELTAVVEVEIDQTAVGSRIRILNDGVELGHAIAHASEQQTVEIDYRLENPRLWWSRGLGKPNQYEFIVLLEKEDGRVIAEKHVKTGLRSIRLITSADADGKGSTFHFELNGVPVFAKGANHIPNDSFSSEVTYSRYRHEIASAAEANMNMLRVWGGGIYEHDDFYTLCDEYGLLVWQDFMFACSLYPGDEAFLNNVREEAEDNVKRLRNHPCIALWCGNNEIDSAFPHLSANPGWGWKKQFTPELEERLWQDYDAVFHQVLPAVVSSFAPGIAYWASSPLAVLSGDSDQHATITSTRGDIHYWGVWHSMEPFENYNVYIGRFMSEYGFQSFPEPRTVLTYAEETDMELESAIMLSHQKHQSGNRLIKDYMKMYMHDPKDFPSFLLMSQVLQAEGIRIAIEAHRRNKPYCMGTLYWQLNDCWPVASWSSMDYYGRWKALQYTVKRSFQDVALSIVGIGERVEFHVVSDQLVPLQGELRIRIFGFDGSLQSELTMDASIDRNTATLVASLASDELLQGSKPEQVVLYAELLQDGEVVESKPYYFVPLKAMNLEAPNIVIRAVDNNQHSSLVVETDKLARHVRLFAEQEGVFSDNDFDLIPGLPHVIQFQARSDGDTAFVPASPGRVTVQSMADWIMTS